MEERILPIGSIVTIANTDLMIISYVKKGKLIEGKPYDYMCCVYPQGMGPDSIFITKNQIEKVKFIGYQDGIFSKFKNDFLSGKIA